MASKSKVSANVSKGAKSAAAKKSAKPAPKGNGKKAKKRVNNRGYALPDSGSVATYLKGAEVGKVKAHAAAKRTETAETETGSVRASWGKHGKCRILAWLGANGFDVATAVHTLARLGIPAKMNCVRAQVGSGRAYVNCGKKKPVKGTDFPHAAPAELSKSEAAELKAIANASAKVMSA
jgi:hypothetical protein